MATRACDFSSFKRPPKPININGSSSSHTPSEKTSSLRSSELDASRDDPGEFTNRKLGTSMSVDASMTQRNDYLGGSTSTFKDMTSTVAPMYSVSSQHVDGFSSFQRTPHANHSTIDRTTLPHDRRHKTPTKFVPTVPTRHEEGNVGSGLLFLDGGRRGVMKADSQHSLDDPLGHRLDRSLAKGRNGNESTESYNVPPYDAPSYSPIGNHSGYVPNGGINPYGYYTQDRMNPEPHSLPPGNGTYQGFKGNIARGSHPNMSSGESGIGTGCDYNTLGMSYEANPPEAIGGYADYRYQEMPTTSRPPQRPSFRDQRQDSEETGVSEEKCGIQRNPQDEPDRRPSGSADEFSQRTMLLPADSTAQFRSDSPEAMQAYDPTASFALGSTYNQTPINSSRRMQTKSKTSFNPFKRKSADDIYKRNNLYGTKNRKSSKHDIQVAFNTSGMTSTGLAFDKPYASTKRPFCPRWQCIALAIAVGLMIFLCAALILYFYVWPTVLQPLVESSKPVDGEWGNWRPWFECSATCGKGVQNRTRECDSPSPEDGGRDCHGQKHEVRTCNAPVECPDCSRICDVGTLSRDCRSCTCEGHVITGKITDEYNSPLPGVKVYKGSGAALLLAGTDSEGEFKFEGVCSNGNNELRLEKDMYRVSRVQPEQSRKNHRMAHVNFAMTRLFLPMFIIPPEDEIRLVDQQVVLCCGVESEQPPTRYQWYKDSSLLDPRIYHYSLESPSLILPELMNWDSGSYSCEVENEAGTVKSEPATLTVYGNWSDVCDPKPRDNYISLPDGCEEVTFNTGSCSKAAKREDSDSTKTTESTSEVPYSRCVAPDQYPNDGSADTCSVNYDRIALRNKYCCKPTSEEEVRVHCKLNEEIGYEMSLKRILSCGCELCE